MKDLQASASTEVGRNLIVFFGLLIFIIAFTALSWIFQDLSH